MRPGLRFGRILFLLVSVPAGVSAQAQPGRAAGEVSRGSVTIPDGTPVPLRFAQAIWGMGAGDRPRLGAAHPGDVIRLVVAADVTVDGEVVIHKGSAAQVTVKNVWRPFPDRNGVAQICTCLSLELNSVQSVDEQAIPVRSKLEGKNTPFELQVHSTRAGAIAKPLSLRESLSQGMKSTFLLNMGEIVRRRDWIPPGTRLTVYVHGNFPLDADAIHDAQQHRPSLNDTGLVMIYRTKGHRDTRVAVDCDSKPVGMFGSQQFVAIEMDPGVHSCSVEQAGLLHFSISGGREYYLYLQYETLAGNWKLSVEDTLEGEDGVGDAQPIGADLQPAKSN